MKSFLLVAVLLLFVITTGMNCNPPACTGGSATYWVTQTGSRTADGSQTRPFGSITSAVIAAHAKDACDVTINVAQGTYPGNLDLTFKTSILGAGKESTIIAGAITADNYDLTLKNLAVQGATGTAVSVSFASFTGVNLRISDTKTVSGDPTSGRGLFLKNVTANLSLSDFANNGGQSIVVTGILSAFKAIGIGVTDSHVNPEAMAGAAGDDPIDYRSAVLIANYAHADIGILQVTHSEGIGIGVSASAKAYLSFVGTDQTVASGDIPGHGLVVAGNAVAEVHNFDFKNSGGCGVFLLAGYMTGFDGKLEFNTFPYCLGTGFESGYPVAACLVDSNVQLENNTKPPFVGGDLPIPGPVCIPGDPCPTPTPPSLSSCATVTRIQ